MPNIKKKPAPDEAEVAAWRDVCELRWGEHPSCPTCGGRSPYWIATRRAFKCAVPWCHVLFTPTTGTVFQQHKLSYRQIVRALIAYERMQPDINVSEFQRVVGLASWKTAHVLVGKMRSVGARNALHARAERWVGHWQRINTAS